MFRVETQYIIQSAILVNQSKLYVLAVSFKLINLLVDVSIKLLCCTYEKRAKKGKLAK